MRPRSPRPTKPHIPFPLNPAPTLRTRCWQHSADGEAWRQARGRPPVTHKGLAWPPTYPPPNTPPPPPPRFLRNPRKPVILAMSRPDAKKNIATLVRAYGECRPLRDIANLVLIMVSS